MQKREPDTVVVCDNLKDVANFILEHTGGNEAVVEHTMAEGLLPVIARELRSTCDSNQTSTALTTSANWSRGGS